MSGMNDPVADERLTDDQRFQNSETSTIKPIHAVMRALAENGGTPKDTTAIIRAFHDAGSTRAFEDGQLVEVLEEGLREGWVEKLGEVGTYRLTENGRNEIGPMMEMELKYV